MIRLAAASLCLLVATQAAARSRAHLPDAVAVAQADVIAVATITEVLPQVRWETSARVKIDRTLFGEASGSHPVLLENAGWKVGDRVIVHLTEKNGVYTALFDGTQRYSAEVEATRVAQIAHRPKWPDPVAGWSSVLVLQTHEIGADEHLDAWIIYRNERQGAQIFRYREKPLAEHTHWTLHVARDGQAIQPLAHPHLDRDETEQHFRSHGHVFDHAIAAGETFAFPLLRINSAEPGWGYKQRLGFRYWPMKASGTYSVWAEDHRFEGRPALHTPPVTVTVK